MGHIELTVLEGSIKCLMVTRMMEGEGECMLYMGVCSPACDPHYSDVIMSPMASQITGVSIVYSNVCSGADKKNIKAQRHWPLRGEFTGDR